MLSVDEDTFLLKATPAGASGKQSYRLGGSLCLAPVGCLAVNDISASGITSSSTLSG
jgi:hypothetical protein